MKAAVCCLLLTVVVGAGCVELPLRPDTKPATPAPARPLTPVTADQVTQANAYEMAEALRQELDREAATGTPPASPSTKALP